MTSHRLEVLFSVACLLLMSTPAAAQLAPTGAHYGARASDTGFEAAVNSRGGYGASVALDLPPVRGGLTLPLGIQYGGRRLGAAGLGWDVPLSYILRDQTISRRRPKQLPTQHLAARELVTMVLDGRSMNLVRKGGPTSTTWVPQTDGPQLEVRDLGGGLMVMYDGNGRTYRFSSERTPGTRLADGNLYLLRNIDGQGNNVNLEYVITTPALPGGDTGLSINLARVSYNKSPSSADCWKNDVLLNYGEPAAQPLSMSPMLNEVLTRTSVLTSIDVYGKANCSSRELLRSHHLNYLAERDPDTGLPRLESVQVFGREGKPENNQPITLAKYVYGVASTPTGTPGVRKLVYAQTLGMTPPAGTPPFALAWVGSPPGLDDTDEAGSDTRVSLLDITGDGRADWTFTRRERPDSEALTMFMVPNLHQPPAGGLPLVPLSQAVFGGEERRPFESQQTSSTRFNEGNQDNVWRQTIDFNGDGRIDIVDAREVPDRWVVYLNDAAGGATPWAIQWRRIELDIHDLRLLLRNHLHFDPDSGYLPLAGRVTGRHVKRFQCFRYNGGPVREKSSWSFATGRCGVPEEMTTIEYGSEKTFTEWELRDLNGDGFPDLVMNSDGVTITKNAFEPPQNQLSPGSFGIGYLWDDVQAHEGRSEVWAMFNRAGTRLVNGTLFDLSLIQTIRPSPNPCGVALWQEVQTRLKRRTPQDHLMRRLCGFADVNGDGLSDRVEGTTALLQKGNSLYGPASVSLPGHMTVHDSGYNAACGFVDDRGVYVPFTDANRPFIATHQAALRDMNGDGIVDYVSKEPSGYFVRFGTGTGYAPPMQIEGDFQGLHLQISFEDEDCFGTYSLTQVGLFDFDGDGKADFIGRPEPGNAFATLRLKAGAVEGTPEAGLLTRVENGYGATTKVTYRNAKDDTNALHRVAFPEIVVTEVETVDESSSSTLVEKSLYAYGTPELMHNPVLDAFVFSGYRRTVKLQRTNGFESIATITDTYPLDPVLFHPTRYLRYVRTGRTSDVTTLSGSFSDFDNDAFALLRIDVSNDPRVIGSTHYTWGARLFQETAGIVNLDCIEMVFPFDWTRSASIFAYDPCTAHGFTFQSSIDSWRGEPGSAPPASANNVHTHSDVTSIDDYGRVLILSSLNDVAVPDDDLVTHTSYPTTFGSNERVLNVPIARSIRTGDGNAILASESWVRGSSGFATSHTVSRRSPGGAVLDDIVTFENASYDASGHVLAVTSKREDGAERTVITEDYDPFGMEPGTIRTVATNGDGTALPETRITIARDVVTLQVTSLTDPNGTKFGTTYDGFDRPLLSTVTPIGGTAGARSSTKYLGFASNEPGGRRIETKAFIDLVPLGNVASAPGRLQRKFLDALGREQNTAVDLGADYQNQQVIVGARTYDTLGRVVFEADPFLSTDDVETTYGTTHYFNTDGTPLCSIRGNGPQLLTMTSDELAEIYPTCLDRSFLDHHEVVTAQASDSLSDGAQAGIQRVAISTAMGRVIERSTWQRGARIELATSAYDPLGHARAFTRFREPHAGGIPVESSWETDSIGQVIALREPESWIQLRSYSRWGEPTRTTFVDDGVLSNLEYLAINSQYDALGRLVHSEQQALDIDGVVRTDPATVYDYRYDQPVDVAGRITTAHTLGRLAQAISPTGTVSFGYDELGQVDVRAFTDDRDGGPYIERYSYRGDGTLDMLEFLLPDHDFSSEQVVYSYDSAGRPQSVVFSDGSTTQELFNAVTVDAFGRIRDAQYGATTYHASYADSGRRLLSDVALSSPHGSRQIAFPATTEFSTAFDPVGRERNRIETKDGRSADAVSTTHIYDALGRLETDRREQGPDIATRVASYDQLGNVLQLGRAEQPQEPGNAFLTYSSNDRDRATQVRYGVASEHREIEYDGVGNIVSEPGSLGTTRRLSYFPGGLIKHIDDDHSTADFRYDALGGLQTLTVTSTDPQYNRNDRHYGDFFAFRNELVNGTPTEVLTRSIPGPGGFVATRHGASGPWIFGFGEPRGNRFFTDADGRFVQDIEYQPYGAATSSIPPGTAQYSSHQWNGGNALEAFGLVQLGARIYDPVIGRFLSRDPLLIPRTAATTNPYAFAMNDPVNQSDPSGLDVDIDIGSLDLGLEGDPCGSNFLCLSAGYNPDYVEPSWVNPSWWSTDPGDPAWLDPVQLEAAVTAAYASINAHLLHVTPRDLVHRAAEEGDLREHPWKRPWDPEWVRQEQARDEAWDYHFGFTFELDPILATVVWWSESCGAPCRVVDVALLLTGAGSVAKGLATLAMRGIAKVALERAALEAAEAAASAAGKVAADATAGAARKLLPQFTQTTVDDLVASAGTLGRGGKMTRGARAIAKKLGHADAGGYPSAFEGLESTQANAEMVIRSAFEERMHVFYGENVIDVYNSAGQGVRLRRDTHAFDTFLEWSRATQ